MNRLDGKVALISGAARGIGASAAVMMAEAGAIVVIGDILAERAQETVAEIKAAGHDAMFAPLDVTTEDGWANAIQAATDTYGKLDILVNNAGMFLGQDIEDVSLDDWHKLMSVNLTGVFLGTKMAIPALSKSGESSAHGSVIVNTSSIAGLVGSQLDPLYSMTKGGVTTFTKSSALNFARKGYRIRVNSIHPGVIETDMGEQTFVARAAKTRSNDIDAARATAISTHPIGRLGVPTDIANGICFLASDDAGFMTGAGLVVDGGLTAQ